MSGLSLEKRTQTLGLSLAKKSIAKIVACVGSAMDISGSMNSLYRNGTMAEYTSRLAPLGLKFDDNGEIDAWAFNTSSHPLDSIKANNIDAFSQKIANMVGGGTSFAPTLVNIYNYYFVGVKGGLFKKSVEPAAGNKPVYLIFQTDGDTDDESETESVLAKLEQQGIYIQFVGVGNATSFRFIKRMGDKFNNVGFFHIPNMETITDEQLYDALINDEFKQFMQTRFPQFITLS